VDDNLDKVLTIMDLLRSLNRDELMTLSDDVLYSLRDLLSDKSSMATMALLATMPVCGPCPDGGEGLDEGSG
jgi:hypothetical protein